MQVNDRWENLERGEKSGEERIEEGAVIDVDRRVCVFSAAAAAAVWASGLGCCSNALINAGVGKGLITGSLSPKICTSVPYDLCFSKHQSLRIRQNNGDNVCEMRFGSRGERDRVGTRNESN